MARKNVWNTIHGETLNDRYSLPIPKDEKRIVSVTPVGIILQIRSDVRRKKTEKKGKKIKKSNWKKENRTCYPNSSAKNRNPYCKNCNVDLDTCIGKSGAQLGMLTPFRMSSFFPAISDMRACPALVSRRYRLGRNGIGHATYEIVYTSSLTS